MNAETSDLQREARALGDPTRHRLFRFIADAARPVGVAELTEYVKLNHNAVRQHLAVLKRATLVIEETEVRDRPGRPSLLYRLHPEAAGKWATMGSYTWLAQMFAEALQLEVSARESGRREGRRRGKPHDVTDESLRAMEQELVLNGFRPSRTDRGTSVEFVLGRCPFVEVATSNPDAVCQLHLGLAEGLAESLGHLVVVGLTAKDPRRAGCRLVLERDIDAPRP